VTGTSKDFNYIHLLLTIAADFHSIMKLIVAGSTGFVATELIRQALSHPDVTSILAFARRETPVPPEAGPNASKLKSVVCPDFENYPESVKQELAGADACIWYDFPNLAVDIF
jgi:N-acetyl-gamma-glutamylphosphate reductase